MTTQQKGEIAHLKVQMRAIEKNVILSKPMIDSRYDYILDDGTNRLRVQVKYAGKTDNRWNGESVIVVLTKPHKNKVLLYSSEEIDAVLAYIPSLDKIVYLPPQQFHNKNNFQLRTKRPQRNYRYNWYEDFLW